MNLTLSHNARKLAAVVFFASAVVLFAGVDRVAAQSASNADSLIPGRGGEEFQPKSVREFLARKKTEKAKKDHEELLSRGEEAIVLAEQLDAAFSRSNQLSGAELKKLESLEKLVSKIRKDLGGDDDDEEEFAPDEERSANTVQEAFSKLKDATGMLVDELKRSSRFTVSVLAIQSTNSVLKIVRFLQFRK